MKNIVYLLGAGASYNAIPVLKDLNGTIKTFLLDLVDIYKDEADLHWHLNNIWIPVFDLAAQHSSVDTFAKKLYLTEEYDQLKLLKCILSAYFIYEQCDRNNPFSNKFIIDNIPYPNTLLDPRYDFFMAALLKKTEEQPKFPENIGIVSWNYDSQIELAYHNYGRIGYNDDKKLRERLGIFPLTNHEYNKNDDSLPENCRIVKLNGTATNILNEKVESYMISSHREIHFRDAKNEISSIIKSSFEKSNSFDKKLLDTQINFAWELEDNWLSKKAVEAAKTIITKASTLVIIGYSFPVFNRDIDKYIFEGNKLEKIYIQDLPGSIEGIRSRVIKTTGVDTRLIELETSVDQFLIPFEL